ncbi:lipopolysaccharide biosynthesis protein [Chryseobacterium sp. A301]
MSKSVFVRGVLFTALSRYSGIFMNLLVTAILARLIQPEAFGIITIAIVFSTFFSIISESGISSAIVQKKELKAIDMSNIFSLTIIAGSIFSLILFLFAPLISSFYEEANLTKILRLLCISLFFAIVNMVPNGILLRERRFKFISIRNTIIQFGCGIIAIIYAFLGGGIYALLISPILGNFILFVVSYLPFKLVPSFASVSKTINKIFSYSIYQFLFTFFNYFSRNLDNIFIGKALGFSVLGYYEKSYRLMLLPVTNISNVINLVAHPILSDYQNDVQVIRKKYEKIVGALASIGFPLSVLLFFNAKFIIDTVYGPNWQPAIPIFELLSLTIGLQMVVSSAGSIFQATNSTKILFFDGLLSTFFIILSLVIGLGVLKSLEYTLILYNVAITFNFLKSFIVLYKFVFKSRIGVFFKVIGIPCIITLVYIFISLLIISTLGSLLLNFIVMLLLLVAAISVSFHFCQLFSIFNYIKNYVRKNGE